MLILPVIGDAGTEFVLLKVTNERQAETINKNMQI